MTVLALLKEYGVTVTLISNHKLKVQGRGHSSKVIDYVRHHKEAIIRELSILRAENTVPETLNLPKACPLIGGPVPDECRFEDKLFRRMVRGGVLPIDGQCPFLRVCKLR